MRFEFKLPDLAEGMVEGEIVDWLVAPGDEVKDEQPVVEVMTDKATVTISSPREGEVLEIPHESGDIVEVGEVLFVLDVEGEAHEEVEAAKAPPKKPQKPQADVGAPPEPSPKVEEPPEPAEPEETEPPGIPRGSGRVLATPATRRLARELGIDIGQVNGTGPAGRVTKEDVRAHHAEGEPAAAPTAPPAAPRAPQAAPQPAPAPQQPARALLERKPSGEEREERVKIRGLRRAIYETMSRSKQTAAHFTYVEEIDCTNLEASRKRLKPAAEAAGVRMTYLPFIAKASLLALRYFPKMNAVMDDEARELVIKHHHHLGIAAATEQGLTVPVVRHADGLTLVELAARIADVSGKARQGKLSPKEAKGSTFTITSLGRIGGLHATPIINHPETAILGVHKMEDRAVVREGQIVARPMMNLSLSFDHRVIDGHEGAAFAQRIKEYLEDPELMLLEMA
ncbi:MAG: dihydrolipoamide acetyltransferase family protein [Myxococcota bacterium]